MRSAAGAEDRSGRPGPVAGRTAGSSQERRRYVVEGTPQWHSLKGKRHSLKDAFPDRGVFSGTPHGLARHADAAALAGFSGFHLPIGLRERRG